MSNILPFPLAFKRQYAAPLDSDEKMTTAQRMQYIGIPDPAQASGIRFSGQQVFDSDENKWYYLNSTLDGWLEFGTGGASGPVDWVDVTGKPAAFNSTIALVDGLAAALAGKASQADLTAAIATFTNGLTWRPPVADLPALDAIPNPQEGWAAQVISESAIYIYTGTGWQLFKVDTDIPEATNLMAGLMSASDKVKLDGIEPEANKYVHPETHPMSMIEGLADALADLEASGGGAAPTFPANIPVKLAPGETFGKYKDGDTIPAANKDAQWVIKDAVTKTVPPTYLAPSASISSTPTLNNREVGYINDFLLTGTFVQRNAGPVTSVEIIDQDGDVVGNAASLALTDFQITDSAQSFRAKFYYADGPVQNNNNNEPDETGRILAGSVTSPAISTVGYRKAFYGFNGNITTSDGVRALQGSLLDPKKGSKFLITVPKGALSAEFAVPSYLIKQDGSGKDIAPQVLQLGGIVTNVSPIFVKSVLPVEGANNFSAIDYNAYKFVPAEAYPDEVVYEVTIQ